MNNDLISRSRLRMNFIQAVEDENPELYGEIILDLIDNAPTVEQPTGEWITANLEKPYGKCNQCGEICEVDNYCGNCGAKMKGGAE